MRLKTKSKTLSIADMCLIGVFTALICVCSQISIPLPLGVPLTLQTLIIPLAGIVLGVRKGCYAIILYILIGICGLPVFSGLKGGIGVLLGPTAGFILSFPLMVIAAGAGAKNGKVIWLLAGLLAGAIVNYLFGMVFFSINTGTTIKAAFAACVYPFIGSSLIKIVMLVLIGDRLKHYLPRG